MDPTTADASGVPLCHRQVPGSDLFTLVPDLAALRRAVSEFLSDAPRAPIPVWLGQRHDLAGSVRTANQLYSARRRPDPVECGIVLNADELPDELLELVRPLATSWLTAQAATAEMERPAASSLLVVGTYAQLRMNPIRSLLLSTYGECGRHLSLISGRDVPSVGWNTAKQYAVPNPAVTAVGLFTDTDRPQPIGDVLVFDDRDFDRSDIQTEILQRQWRRVVFQGHGKDDSINLGEFTICGKNNVVDAMPGALGPRCAYGLPCYKAEDKLVPLNEVAAAEVVLSACNSGPLSDLALYDPKYQLLLNALDGPGQTVAAAVSVHDSDRPENMAWMHATAIGADSVDTLNASLAGSHPYPAFLRFGLPDPAAMRAVTERRAEHLPDELILTVGTRLNGLLAGDLLPSNHTLRPRLTKLARKVNQWVARSTHQADQAAAEIRRSLEADLQSLDYVIADQVVQNPETDIMDYPGYFGDRSRLDHEVHSVTCHCGRPAQRFVKRGLLPHILDTTCVICMRCGDVTFQLPDAPELLAYAADEVAQGCELEVRLLLRAARRGPVRLGLFVPTYLRQDTQIKPAHTKLKANPGREQEVIFYVRFAPNTAPQAYYFTAFVVQDLAISTARRHFGIVPVSCL
jgi:hypothetical protein